MKGEITVERRDYPKQKQTFRNGSVHTTPAHYECYYRWNGKEIAKYNSRDDTVYLNSDLLYRDFNLSYAERMKRADNPDMWSDLASLLCIDDTTRLAEYFNV